MARILEAQSDAYREQRRRVLDAERAMRNQREETAALRRSLPAGPAVDDYTLREAQPDRGRTVRLSELFGDSDTLVMYNMMYGPGWDEACPMCSMWLDGLNGVAQHVRQRASFVVVAKADADKLRQWAELRGWGRLRMLSSRESTFNHDLGFEDDDDNVQLPGVSVFTRDSDGTIRLFYTGQAELAEDDARPYEGDPRGIDSLSPVWNMFDLLPGGRGDWYPDNRYPVAQEPALQQAT